MTKTSKSHLSNKICINIYIYTHSQIHFVTEENICSLSGSEQIITFCLKWKIKMNLKQLLSLKLSQGKVASCVTCKSTVHFIKEFYAIENYGLKFFLARKSTRRQFSVWFVSFE